MPSTVTFYAGVNTMIRTREIDDAILDEYLDCCDMDELTAAEAAALEMVLCPMR